MDILLSGEVVDALSVICHKDSAYRIGQNLTAKLKDIIPRQMFEVAIQAAVGGRVIARTTIKALRKNVLDKMLWRRYFPQAQAFGKTEKR